MLIYWIFAFALLIFVAAVWGVFHLRHSYKTAESNARNVTLDQIVGLRVECEKIFLEKFSETLALSDFEESARTLSDRLDNVESLKSAFSRPGFYWYFVLPVGAFIGELIRIRTGGQWLSSAEGGLEMRIPISSEFATTYPFDKVLKQVTSGAKGDLYAYLISAARLDEAVASIEKQRR